jgi:uncharacterized protein
VVDGGSDDNTLEIASELDCVVIESDRGKSIQMNAGAHYATGEILLFLHGDSLVPKNYDTMIRSTLKESSDTILGAFSFETDNENLMGMSLLNRMTNWRCRMLQLPYGDQGLFLFKKKFDEIGGFSDINFFEDFEFVRKLQKNGFIRILNSPLITSSRRWVKKGVFYSVFLNQWLIICYYFGTSTDQLAKWYYS